MCVPGLFGGGDTSAQVAQQARVDEIERQRRVSDAVGQINQNFSAFNDDFYNQRANAYTAYATPQLEEQYARAKEDLTYALSRAGTLNSSTAAQRQADLRTQYDRQRQAIVDQGLSLSNQARTDTENARSSLVSQAGSAADPGSAAGSAAARAAALAAPASFSPLGPLFANVTAGLAGAVANSRDAAQAAQLRQALSGATIYNQNPSSGSGTVIGSGGLGH